MVNISGSGSAAATTSLSTLLDRGARNRAVGTEDAAVAWLGLEHRVALFALVEPLAGIHRHHLGLGVAALGAGQRRFRDHPNHLATRTKVE